MGFCRNLTCLNVDKIIKLLSIVRWWCLKNVKLSLKWINASKKLFQNSFLGILIKYWWNIALYSKFHARFGNKFIFLLTCLICKRMYSHICFYCFIYRGKYSFRLHGINICMAYIFIEIIYTETEVLGDLFTKQMFLLVN